MLNMPAPVNDIPDIAHLTGDWLTVARMHVSILTWDEASVWDRQVSESALKTLLKYYDPDLDFKRARLIPVMKSKRVQSKAGKAASALIADKPLPEGMLTVEQVAAQTGLHKKTIQRYCNIGWWKAIKRKRRLYIYPDQEFKTQHKQPEPAPEADDAGQSMMTLAEAADRAGISYACAARWFRKGKWRGLRLPDRRVMIYAAQVTIG